MLGDMEGLCDTYLHLQRSLQCMIVTWSCSYKSQGNNLTKLMTKSMVLDMHSVG